MLTDSGGFQVFSLAENRKLTEDGCTFRSHIDGSKHIFTPENNVDTQRMIGADIIMALDECTPGDADHNYALKSLKLTQKWLARGIKRFKETEPLYGYRQFYFPIIQGCVYPDLRRMAAEHVVEYDMDGYAIGGLSVGEPTEKMYEMLEVVDPILPKEKPRYLMGVGTPSNIIEAVARGVDFFDCVMPSRNGRHGKLFTWEGTVNILNEKYATDDRPVSESCSCPVCRSFSRAYLRHLFKADEVLALRFAVLHNLYFYNELMAKIREAIDEGTFEEFRQRYSGKLEQRA
jgi:queuine tRNA-ribosyltransferase